MAVAVPPPTPADSRRPDARPSREAGFAGARRARPVRPDPGAQHRAEHVQRAGAATALAGLSSRVRVRRSLVHALATLAPCFQPDCWRLAACQPHSPCGHAACADRAAWHGAPADARAGAGRGAPPRFAAIRPSRARALGFLAAYPLMHAGDGRPGRLDQVDRQFRHPDPDLHHAGLGPEHRRRPRRPARPRLRRLLCRRRLRLRAAGHQ